MDISSPYYARCYKKLESLGLPTTGWVCEQVIDLEEPEFTCQLCQYEGIRYVHVMRNVVSPIRSSIGGIDLARGRNGVEGRGTG